MVQLLELIRIDVLIVSTLEHCCKGCLGVVVGSTVEALWKGQTGIRVATKEIPLLA